MGSAQDVEPIRSAVAAVWAEILPGVPIDEDLAWSDAGIDSLRSLQLLLGVERRLGRKLSFDLFARDLTLGDLILSLAQVGQAAVPQASSDKRTLFLAPGIFGDEPRLADLRRALRNDLSCQTLDLPDLDQSSKVLSDLTATARPLVQQILQAQPEGPIAIAGYSFGSLVAYEIALELEGAGRTVDLLCLIDMTPPPTEVMDSSADRKASPLHTVVNKLRAIPKAMTMQPGENLTLYLERLVYRALMVSQQYALARWLVARNMERYDIERGRIRRRHLLEIFRRRAMMAWRPAPYDGRVLLIASDGLHALDGGGRWNRWCRNLEVVVVGGDHHTIFDPGPLARLAPALVRTLRPPATELA